MFLSNGIQEGQWLNVAYEAYMPRRDDLPYHDWIKGMRGDKLARLGVRDGDLPESQDPALTRMSDTDWLRGGPR
ncbi:MAG: hypothetical protein H0X24_05200, partial [Ktedonobacterales bacterium]|nr:hypothetical protein [Ktedonobacterales bacterium]